MLKILAFVFSWFFAGKGKPGQKEADLLALLPRGKKFAEGDLAELDPDSDARDVLGLEFMEKFAKGSFEVVRVGEADGILRGLHPQFLLLRKRRDVMIIPGKFSGAHFRKLPPKKSSAPAKTARSLARV